MKMKTLEEINEDFLQNKGHDVLCPTAIKLLRQEAINRIKNCCQDDNIGGSPLRKAPRCIACKRDMWFHDLKEEDLKCK